MKDKIVVIIIAFFLGISSVLAIDLDINSENAILYNLDESTILYEKNSDEQISIASMTKIMTAIVALENISNLDEQVTIVSKDFQGLAEVGASTAGFQIGERLTYRDLLYGLLLPSGAEAAQALTRTIAGGKDNFVKLMNEKAQELNLQTTHFANETGLDELDHYSSVKDVATLLKYAWQNEDFKEIFTTSSYKTSDGLVEFKSTVESFDEKYHLKVDYILGGKTGTTKKAGRCLASIAKSNKTTYLLVTAKAPMTSTPYNMFDAKKIYEYFIDNYQNQDLVKENDLLVSLKTLYGKQDKKDFYAKETISKYLPNDYDANLVKLEYEGTEILTTKIPAGEKVGTVKVFYDEEEVTSLDITLDEKIEFSMLEFMNVHKIKIIGIILLIIILLFLIKRKNRKKRRRRRK